jgi:hypothetical protein
VIAVTPSVKSTPPTKDAFGIISENRGEQMGELYHGLEIVR